MTVHAAIPKRKRLTGQFHRFTQNPASAGFLLSEYRQQDECLSTTLYPKKAAYRSVSPLYAKPRFGGVFAI
ncbi:hypothetical protein EB840_20085 [Klebsiella quasipneumoniae]|nr:hypothetical protein EB840_20085 [Klebsiella quasipneumoniae]